MLAAGKTIDEIAAAMHMSRPAVQIMIERGCSEKVARAEIEDTEPNDGTPGCPRCHLRGAHECLRSADFTAQRSESVFADRASMGQTSNRRPPW